MTRILGWAMLILILGLGIGFSQERGKLNYTDIEKEIKYDDLIATYEIYGCEAVGWDYKADWKDGVITRFSRDGSITHINDKGFKLRNAQPAPVWFSHSYQTENTNPGYPVVFYDVGQCAGFEWPKGQFTHTFTAMVKVWERVPVASVKASVARVKRGAQVDLTIMLEREAPPSGTRVFLQMPKGVFVAPPEYVVVPVGKKEITPTFTVLPNAPLGVHVIGAWTANAQKTHMPSTRITVIK